METYRDRLKQERIDLGEKVQKLSLFFNEESFQSLPEEEKELLNKQFSYMVGYLDILQKRLREA